MINTTIDKHSNLLQYTLRLGDNSLILGQRLAEWSTYAPEMEEDIALSNIALDLIGQTRAFYSYATELEGQGKSEDDLAFLRDITEFTNVLLVEQSNGDFAKTIARQFLMDTYNFELYSQLQHSQDQQLAAIAEKSLKEVTYHCRHSSQWVIRLGDGTEESHRRIQSAFDELWIYTGELFTMDTVVQQLLAEGVAADPVAIKQNWDKTIDAVFSEATLTRPDDAWMADGGKQGQHSEELGHILTEMQYMQRAYPGCNW